MGLLNSKQSKYDIKSNRKESPPKELKTIHKGSILGLYAHDPFHVYGCSDDKRISISENYCARTTYLDGHSKAVNKVIQSKDFLFSSSRDLSIKQWDLKSSKNISTIEQAHDLNIASIIMSPNENILYSGGRDYVVKCWDIETQKCKQQYFAPRNIVTTLEVDPNNPHLLFQASEDLCIRVWDTRTSRNVPSIHIQGFVYFPLCLSKHGTDTNLLVSGCKGIDGHGGEVKLFDLRNTNKVMQEYIGHKHDVTGCRFLSTTNHILSVSKDGHIYAWDYMNTTSSNDSSIDSTLSSQSEPQTSTTSSVMSQNEKYAMKSNPLDAVFNSLEKYYTCMTNMFPSADPEYSNVRVMSAERNHIKRSLESCLVGAFDGSISLVTFELVLDTKSKSNTKYSIHVDELTSPYFHPGDSQGER